jgi:hypothetical protein
MAPALAFFDCNARIGTASQPHPAQFLDKAGLLAEWDRLGIGGGLVYHAWAQEWDPAEGNTKLEAEIAGEARLLPIFAALPGATGEMPPPAEFAAGVRARHGAVRLFPRTHSFELALWCCGDLLGALEAAQVPVQVDIAETSWGDTAGVLAAFPRLHVIVLGVSYRADRLMYPLWEKHDTLHIESATYQVHRGIEAVCARFGPERIIFGTGLPVREGGGAIAQIVYAEVSEEAKAAMAGGTMKGLVSA